MSVFAANHQVAFVEFAFHAVEGDEGGAIRQLGDNNLAALNLGEVEGMERLTHLHKDEVGDIDNIVDGAEAYSAELILEPVGRLLNLDVADGDAAVTLAGLIFVLSDLNLDGIRLVTFLVDGKGFIDRRPLYCKLLMLTGVKHCNNVASNADMGSGIRAVGGDGDFEGIVIFDIEVFAGGHSDGSVVGQHHDAVMAGTQLEFVLGAKHAFANLATQFTFLYLIKLSVGSPDFGPYLGTDHLLAGGNIGSTANDMQRLGSADIDSGDVQMVRIWVRFTGKDLGNNDMLQAALDGLNLFYTLNLQSGEGQQIVQLMGCQICFYIITKPIIRYFHLFIV